MVINFLVNEVAGGWEPTDTRLGGTEESVVRWAEELVKRGHGVNVFRNSGTYHDNVNTGWGVNGVMYRGRAQYTSFDNTGDICINVKSAEIAPKEPTLYLTNETNASDLDLSAYAGVIWPSQWAEENIPVNNPNRFILPHGYDPEKIYPDRKIKKQCLYASSPDRGLSILLEAWPKVHKVHPDATLIVTYGAEYQDVPGVMFLGNVDEESMNELYRTSDIWCHPCTGGELYGITGIKAQAADCWPVIIPTMALSETVKYGTFTTKERYADALIEALNDHPEPPQIKLPSWEDSTNILLEVIQSVL